MGPPTKLLDIFERRNCCNDNLSTHRRVSTKALLWQGERLKAYIGEGVCAVILWKTVAPVRVIYRRKDLPLRVNAPSSKRPKEGRYHHTGSEFQKKLDLPTGC